MSISAQIRIRRDTAAAFTAANPTLAFGEIAYETDTGNIKVGTGSTAWTALAYINPFRNSPSADQTNTALGRDAGMSLVGGQYNTAIGADALETASSSNTSTAIGSLALRLATGSQNTAVGALAGAGIASATRNVAVGSFALNSVSGSECVAVGADAAYVNRAAGIVAVGSASLDANTTGTGNVAVGRDALGAATTAIGTFTTTPVAAGSGYTANQTGVTVTLVKKSGTDTFTGTVQAALTTNASGAVTAVQAAPVSAGSTFTGSNVIFEPSGFGAGSGCEISIASIVTSYANTAVGNGAGMNVYPGPSNAGTQNTFVGASAGVNNTTGRNNTVVGATAGYTTTGSGNTCIGSWAGRALTTGTGNVIIGGAAVANTANLLTGSANVIIGGNDIQSGYGPASNLTSGYQNILIGHSANTFGPSDYNSIVISGTPSSVGDGNNTTVIGNTSTTSTRIPAGNLTLSNGQYNATNSGNAIQGMSLTTTGTAGGSGAGINFTNDVGNIASVGLRSSTTGGGSGFPNILDIRQGVAGTPSGGGVALIAAGTGAGIQFFCGGTATASHRHAVIGNAGNLSLDRGNLVLSAGAGIDFSADANAAGMTSELLDDYEEGTWTPVYSPNTGSFATLTMDVVSATYTKIGRQVTVRAFIQTDNVDATGASGALRITGLPFAGAGSSGGLSSVAISFATEWAASGFPSSGITADSANTAITLWKRAASDGATASVVVTDMTTGANADRNRLVFAATYFTA